VQGQDVTIDSSLGVKINDANVVRTDIKADNGVIHVIDGYHAKVGKGNQPGYQLHKKTRATTASHLYNLPLVLKPKQVENR
jgi:hypothetical protein